MKFVTVRELRGRTSELWDELERQRELIVTGNGKPIAILSATDAESLERSLQNICRCRAADALSYLQRDAARRGLDQLTMDDVDEEIARSRGGVRSAAKGNTMTNLNELCLALNSDQCELPNSRLRLLLTRRRSRERA